MADYTYYRDVYLGTLIPEADFPSLAARAEEAVRYLTDGRSDTAAGSPEVENAVCAVADVLFSAKSDKLESESAGSYSVSYRAAGSLEKRVSAAAAPYLARSGMMFRGVGG